MYRLLRSTLGSCHRAPTTPFRLWLRQYSAWISSATKSKGESFSGDVERLFTQKDVQSLLTRLCGLDAEGKIFASGRMRQRNRSHFALMTDERFEETRQQILAEAKHFLQFVPLKEPRSEEFQILSRDPELANFDQSNFIFTDISVDATDQDRTVVVREIDGTLRTATPEERDRMNRVYYEKPNRPVSPPPVFKDPHLQDALNRDEHEFIMDWACWFYEPDDPEFVQLSRTVFDRTVAENKLHILHSTRHFGTLAFYLAINGRLPPLLNFFGGQGMLTDAANAIRLHKALHPNWRLAVSGEDSDRKVIEDYVTQNLRFKPELGDLLAFLRDGIVKRRPMKPAATTQQRPDLSKATVNAGNITGQDGPLGAESEDYDVKVVLSEGGGDQDAALTAAASPPRKGRRPWGGAVRRQQQDKEDK